MKHFLWVFAVISFCVSCGNAGNEPRILTIKDVKIPDPEKDAILSHNIRYIYGYDTADLFSRYPKARAMYGKRNREDSTWPKYLGAQIERYEYDRRGNRLYYYLSPHLESMWCMVGTTPDAEYDTLGFMKTKGRKHYGADSNGRTYADAYARQDSFSYVYLPVENILLSIRWDMELHDRSTVYFSDTSTFRLDEQGKPIVYAYHGMTFADGHRIMHPGVKCYTYNGDGSISGITNYCPRIQESEYDFKYLDQPDRITTRYYYYTGKQLDSSNEYREYRLKKRNRWDRRYYKDGIIARAVLMDTLHVYYLHTTHAQKETPGGVVD